VLAFFLPGHIAMFDQIRRDFQTYRSRRHRGWWAMVWYRFGQWINARRRGPIRGILNALYAEFSVFVPVLTGVSLDRATVVGASLHIVHPGLILIHPKSRIGDRVGLMHGVTLGTTPTDQGAPTVGDDVFIGAHATLLGSITIGNGARVAANSLVVCDVPPGATAIGVPANVYPAMPAAGTRTAGGRASSV
jgi:serine O-acetyltransferase